jgi:hypothetical protein
MRGRPLSPTLICPTASAKVGFEGWTCHSPENAPVTPLGRDPV